MSEATSESGAMTFDAAVASLIPTETAKQTTGDGPNNWGENLNTALEAPAEAADEPEEPEGDSSTPEEAEAEPETQAEGEEGAEPEQAATPLDPPLYWKPEAKEAFSKLDPALQAEILAQEGPREEATRKAKAEAAEKAQAAESELGKVGQLAEALAERLPKWLEAFESRWGPKTPDWVAIAQEHGVEAMTLAKTQYEAERQQLAEAEQATKIAQTQAHQAFVRAEFARLPEVEPELADPVKGAERRKAAVEHAISRGIPPEAINSISAAELSIAYDAMRFRQGQAALKAAPKPKPAATASKAPVRPAAAASHVPPSKQAAGKFHQAPTVENAIALLLAPKRP